MQLANFMTQYDYNNTDTENLKITRFLYLQNMLMQRRQMLIEMLQQLMKERDVRAMELHQRLVCFIYYKLKSALELLKSFYWVWYEWPL